ncbi:MAG: aldose epimerase family protein [bacterium]
MESTIFTLTNSHGIEARIMNYGGIVQSLKVPDRNGILGDVVLGYDSLAEYEANNSPYFGAIIGRFGNRIAGGRFMLNGKVYALATNSLGNSLHGGLKGFDKVVWSPFPKMTSNGPSLELRYVSQDGEEGYPGNLSVTAIYTLTENNELTLDFTAVTDQDTVVNLTHHSYFNLACQGDVLNHVVTLNSDMFTPISAGLIPSGKVRSVTGTPLDFRKPTLIGAQIDDDDPIIKNTRGYDHNLVLNKPQGELGLAARVFDPASGRVMEVWTTAPAFQFYTGNFLDGTITGKAGRIYQRRAGLCIEPEHYPDSPNQPSFPSTVLRPGETYRNTMIYRFSVM